MGKLKKVLTIAVSIVFTVFLLVIECGAIAIGCIAYDGVQDAPKVVYTQGGMVVYDSTEKPTEECDMKIRRVVIDAGHGGRDGGVTSSNGLRESDVTLKISQHLKFELEVNGYEVTLTRNDDEGLYDEDVSNRKRDDMRKRHDIIEIVQPDLVVSIHLNNFIRDKSVHGLQCFYQKGREIGQNYANQIQQSLNKSGLFDRDRTAMSADYYILETEYPSVLIECGFLSNVEEERRLASDEYQRELAREIAEAIVDVLG